MASNDTSANADDARTWWGKRRLLYNIGLVVAGVLAFACYVAVLDRRINDGSMPDAEITLFTTAFQGVGYLFMMGIANLCYFAGPLSERMVNPKNIDRYRHVMFWFGFCFSVLLPFSIPALVAWG